MDRVEVINALVELKDAGLKLLDTWNKVEGDEILGSDTSVENYPFTKNFEDVVVDIIKWVNNIEVKE